jgi:hypothetical protein
MNRTRLLLFSLTIIIVAASIFSYVFLHTDFLIRKWNLPLDPPGFYDSRQFTWASEAYAQGYDPLIENPVNPRGHQLNYPRIWHLLFLLGINESHTNIMGTVVTILFFLGLGIFWFSKKFDTRTYLVLSIVILSPAVMLGVERSNIELVLFFVLSLGLTLSYYSTIPALGAFLFAAVLKIYPVFGFTYLLKEDKRRFWMLFLTAMGIFILYALFSFDDFLQVYKTTPKLVGSSFGINVFWRGLSHKRFLNLSISESLATALQVFSYALAITIVAVTVILGVRRKDPGLSQGQYIDAFRVGACIYAGCFLLMNTHDYRLIFLIFTVPQLIVWIKKRGNSLVSLPLMTLAAMMFSMWHFFVMRFLGRKITFVMEEFSNWIMLAGLLYLFVSTLPEWFKDYIRRPVGLKEAD